MVRQEYIPTNVDEGEFEMSVSAPEGTSLAAMQEVLDRVYAELKTTAGRPPRCYHRRHRLSAGRSTTRACMYASTTSKIAFSPSTRLVQKTLEGKPAEAFQGIYSQRDVMQAIRERLREFQDLRVRVGNLQTMNQGSAPYDIDFAIRGPDLIALNDYSERLRRGHERHPGSGRCRHYAASE